MPNILIIILNAIVVALIDAKTFIEVPIKDNALGLPIVNLWNDYALLLDTGSEEVWLADKTCKNCLRTTSVCPHLHDSPKQINYFKGYVRGDYAFVNTSFGSNKIICVRQSQNLKNIEANGILGIRGNSTGKKFLINYMQPFNLSSKAISLYLGLKESRLFLGQTPPKYKKQESLLQSSANWRMTGASILLNKSQTLKTTCKVYFDTGSNLLIFQEKVYQVLAKFIRSFMTQNHCYETRFPLIFQCYLRGIDFNQPIVFSFDGRNNDQVAFRMNMQNIVKIKDDSYHFMIEKTEKDICILGIPAFRGYVIEFSLDGPLKIYQSNYEELAKLQISNYKTILCEYVICIIIISFLGLKAENFIVQTISRKIVI